MFLFVMMTTQDSPELTFLEKNHTYLPYLKGYVNNFSVIKEGIYTRLSEYKVLMEGYLETSAFLSSSLHKVLLMRCPYSCFMRLERENRTLQEMSIFMLHEINLPYYLWDEATLTS